MKTEQALERLVPFDGEEKKAQKRILFDWEKRGEQLLFRETNCHFTASAMVFDPTLTKVLMVHHNLYGTWTWPGGHTDGSGDFLKEALREVREETGIGQVIPYTSAILSMDVLPVPEQKKNGKVVPPHTHYSVGFGCVALEDQPLRCEPEENSAVRWIPFDEIETYSGEPHMIAIYRKIYQKMLALREKKAALFPKLPGLLLPWYETYARELPWRQDQEPYHVWLSEIMLQQTRVEAVKGYYERFLRAFPTVKKLAEGEEDTLLKLWEGLGYYNRARNLQKAARMICEKYHGKFPQTYEELLSLPGVGEYTAGAVASICFDLPEPAVDGNVLRVITRLTETFSEEHPKLKKAVTESLRTVYPKGNCGSFTQSLMELGATVCVPNGMPKCEECPLAALCISAANGTQTLLPVKKKKPEKKLQKKTVFLLRCGERIAVDRRTEQGVLHGMWQFPNTDGLLTEDQIADILSDWGVKAFSPERSVERSHVFTHIRWEMRGYVLACGEMTDRFRWVTPQELAGEISLPTAFRQFLEDVPF